jgi:hypothetical protein
MKTKNNKVRRAQKRSVNEISCLDELRTLAETLGTQWKHASDAEQLLMAQVFTLVITSFFAAAHPGEHKPAYLNSAR